MSLVTFHPWKHAILHEAIVSLFCSQVSHAWSLYSSYKLSPAALHDARLSLKQIHTHTPGTHANPCAFTLLEDMHWFSSSPHFLLSFSLALFYLSETHKHNYNTPQHKEEQRKRSSKCKFISVFTLCHILRCPCPFMEELCKRCIAPILFDNKRAQHGNVSREMERRESHLPSTEMQRCWISLK